MRRDGRWTLPHRLALRTAWCDVMLDLTSAVRSGPELVIELRGHGDDVELVLVPGMVVVDQYGRSHATTLTLTSGPAA